MNPPCLARDRSVHPSPSCSQPAPSPARLQLIPGRAARRGQVPGLLGPEQAGVMDLPPLDAQDHQLSVKSSRGPWERSCLVNAAALLWQTNRWENATATGSGGFRPARQDAEASETSLMNDANPSIKDKLFKCCWSPGRAQ